MARTDSPPARAKVILVAAIALAVVLVVTLTLVPVLSAQRGSAQRLCVGRLRAIGGALAQYAEDSDGLLPPGEAWMDGIAGLLKSQVSLHCPEAGRKPGDPHGYAMDRAIAGGRLADVPNPARQSLVFDAETTGRNAVAGEEALPRPGRHRGLNNVLRADLSVTSQRR
jgi:hypothetical protein